LERRDAPSILVVGGGIAGIEAALGAASLGAKVYLVESKPSLGGRAAQLSLLYPKLDPALDMVAARMDALAKASNVEVLTCSEVLEAKREGKGFKVKVLRRARRVDLSKCDACGKCSEACPVEVSNEFDLGLSKRKAVYTPFDKAFPRAYVIDEQACLYVKDKSCTVCRDACPKAAINLDEQPVEVELAVDAVVIATGYDPYDMRGRAEYGFGLYADVINGLQLERMLSPNGPTKGEVVKPSTGERPKSVAIVLCAGSRDETALPYCCRVGCMAGLKHAYEVKKKYGDEVEVYLCFNDIRAAGKGYEEFYREVRRSGITMVRGQPSEIRPAEKGLTMKVFDESTNKLLRLNVDLVVLEAGIVPSEGSAKVAKAFGVELGPDGFIAEADPRVDIWSTKVPGVFVAGACHSPKDIAEAVAQAKAAALAAVAYAKSA